MLNKLLTAAFVLYLSGCAATGTLISKRDLDVQTKTSSAIFVDPVATEKRTIYLDVRSGVQEFDRNEFKQYVATRFENSGNGYRIVDNPESAHYQMLIYVLNLEQSNESAAASALNTGYRGGAAAAGAVAGAMLNDSNRFTGAGVGALAAGAADFAAGAFVKDVYFVLVADVQVREAASSGDTDRNVHQTRVVTTANQANLDLVDAIGPMFDKTAYALAGFF